MSREIANDGTIYWEFEIHVIEWWDRPVTRKVAVAIRNDSGEFSFGQDKFSRQRGGVNYRAHTRMAILPGDTITMFGYADIAAPFDPRQVLWFGTCQAW